MPAARRVVHGYLWAHLAPPTYSEVMREAADNDLVVEPTQPAAEHTALLTKEERVRFRVELSPPTLEWEGEATDEDDACDQALDSFDAVMLSGGTWWVRELDADS